MPMFVETHGAPISMHGEAGRCTWPLGSGSSFVDGDGGAAFALTLSEAKQEANISMHGEGGHFSLPLGSGSSFVDRDGDWACALALGEGQDGHGRPLFCPDGSLAALEPMGASSNIQRDQRLVTLYQ